MNTATTSVTQVGYAKCVTPILGDLRRSGPRRERPQAGYADSAKVPIGCACAGARVRTDTSALPDYYVTYVTQEEEKKKQQVTGPNSGYVKRYVPRYVVPRLRNRRSTALSTTLRAEVTHA